MGRISPFISSHTRKGRCPYKTEDLGTLDSSAFLFVKDRCPFKTPYLIMLMKLGFLRDEMR